MEMFELSKYSETQSGSLSGGNKRKLCTGIAFMSRAPLVLLDEPTR
jgi:ABC-type multidrug transport system ATPase subunit